MHLAALITVLALCCIQYSWQLDFGDWDKLIDKTCSKKQNKKTTEGQIKMKKLLVRLTGWSFDKAGVDENCQKKKKKKVGGGRSAIDQGNTTKTLKGHRLYEAGDFQNDSRCIDQCSGNLTESPPEFHIDICFAVQTSCYLDAAKTYKKAMKTIAGILEKLQKEADDANGFNHARFTILTYAEKVKEWKKSWGDGSASRIKEVNKYKIKPGKCDCQSRTKDALEECEDILKKNKRDISGLDIPQVIIAFNDGNTQHTAYDNPLQHILNTAKCIKDLADGNKIIPKVIRYPSGVNNPDRDGEIEFIEYENDATAVGSVLFNYVIECPEFGITLPVSKITTLNEDPDCNCCLRDIVIVLDASNSILPADLDLMLYFAHDLILDPAGVVHPTVGARFALFTYCGQVTRHISLNENLLKHELLNALIAAAPGIVNCKYTHTHDAITRAHNELTTYPRQDAGKVILVTTDGRTWLKTDNHVLSPPTATINAAALAHNDGINVFCIGTPNHKDRNDGFLREWQFIGSPPATCSVVDMQEKNGTQPTFLDLDKARIYISFKICCVDMSVLCINGQTAIDPVFCNNCINAFCP